MTYRLALIADLIEADAGASTTANPTEAGYWKRIALAAESLAGAGTSANTGKPGYQRRTADALETLAGATTTANRTEDGYVRRMVAALEALGTTPVTGSWLYQLQLALDEYVSGPPPADYFVTTDAELVTAVAAATSGQIIELADSGTFTAQANINGKTGITLRGETYGVPHLTAGLTATSSTGCKVLGLKITRTAPNNTASYSNLGVVEIGSSSGIEIGYCTIQSNDLDAITMQDGSSGSLYFQGYRGISGSTVGSFNIHHNDIGDCYRGISVIATTGTTNYIEYNTGLDFYQNPCETAAGAGATIYIRHNSWAGIWANVADSGAPHSSVMGFSAQAAWTPIVIGNILLASTWRRFNSTGSAAGTWGTGSGPKFNDTTSPTNAMHYTNAVFGWNICAVDDSIGFEPSLGNFAVFYNTIVKDMTSGVPATAPAMNFHDIGAGSYCCKNVVINQLAGSHAGSLGGPNGIHDDWYTKSWDNIVLRPNGLAGTSTGDLNSYSFHFDGPTFTDLTVSNIVTAFTPKVGSYLTSEGIGAVGTGYDWTARSYSSLPTFTKPKTSNATGTTPALTQFDGTNDWMQVAGTAPVIDMTNRRALTIALYASWDGVDTGTGSYTDSSGTDYAIVRKPTSGLHKMEVRYKNTAGAVICEIDSNGNSSVLTNGFGQRSTDGVQLWVFTLNQTTGRFFLMRGKEIDPFPIVTTFKDDNMANTRTSFGIMGQNDLSPPTGTGLVNGRFGRMLITDEFIDLSVAANHDSIVATDGTPADWGSNGSNLTGTQPRFYVYGDAASLNAGGLNYGSSTDTTTMTGSVTNA